MPASIEVKGLVQLRRKVRSAERMEQTLRPAAQRGGETIRREISQEPGPIPAGHWRANTSERQRRAFFAALRSGRASGGRTGRYPRGWQAEIIPMGGELSIRVRNTVAYGPYVGKKGSQARFHRGRWPTDEEVLARTMPGILRDFEQTIQAALR